MLWCESLSNVLSRVDVYQFVNNALKRLSKNNFESLSKVLFNVWVWNWVFQRQGFCVSPIFLRQGLNGTSSMRLIGAIILLEFFEASTIGLVFPVPDISKQTAHVGLSKGPDSSLLYSHILCCFWTALVSIAGERILLAKYLEYKMRKVPTEKTSKQLQIWIGECSALSAYELNQQLKSINEQSVKSFVWSAII